MAAQVIECEFSGRVRRWDGANIRFVEDKPVDFGLLEELLAASRSANQWSNFGPVSLQLERDVQARLGLGPELRAVMCSSGTAALHALVGMHETYAGRSLRWVTSSFGFYCAVQGPLADARVVDCDSRGMLDLQLVDPEAIDGLVVVNTFGAEVDLGLYVDFARQHDKVLIVDSALGFGSHSPGPNEFISFHHTKPWGFGEGGVALVAAEHEHLFRSIVSLGHGPGQPVNRRASNYKASDPQCAFQFMRLAHMGPLAPEYKGQYRRIVQVALSLGIDVLGGVLSHPSIPASVPLQLPTPVEDVRTSQMPTGRYYYPLAETPRASDIYARMVNVPCHAGMASLDDDAIRAALQSILERA